MQERYSGTTGGAAIRTDALTSIVRLHFHRHADDSGGHGEGLGFLTPPHFSSAAFHKV